MDTVRIGEDYTDHNPLLVSYHHKMYGLGEVRDYLLALQLTASKGRLSTHTK